MAELDLAIVREMFAAWNEGSVDRMIDFWSEDGDWRWEDAPELPGAREVVGREAVEAHLREVMSLMGDIKLDVEELMLVEGRALVVVSGRFKGARSGLEMEDRAAHLVDFEDGRVRRWRVFRDRDQALAAARG